MSELDSKYKVNWYIRNVDTNDTFFPQFRLEGGVQSNFSTSIGTTSRFGFDDPVVQWASGELSSYRFKTVLFSRNAEEEILDKFELLQSFTKRDNTVGRIPICQFNYGQYLQQLVLVKSVTYTIIDIDEESGLPFHIDLDIELVKYTPFERRTLNPTKQFKESFHYAVSDVSQTYEQIAKKLYGDPLLGDRLRKRHPESPMAPKVGTLIKAPSKKIIKKERVYPESHIFNLDSTESNKAFQEVLDSRASKKIVDIK